MPLLSWKDVLAQSNAVFGQFGESKWIPFAKKNVLLPRKNTKDFHNIGIGKFALLCGMGESLEENINLIKENRDKFDIFTCDKGFGVLLDNGIKADFVMLCDCNIPFHHIEKYINDSVGVKLICTPYANIEWTHAWKGDLYFFVNEDAIKTEKKFMEIFGEDIRIIPAGSNVSNAMVIFCTGSNYHNNINYCGYEKYILIGYDYSWRPDGNYYAFKNPKPKRYYMNHRTLLDINGDVIQTSENLLFSAKWLMSYNEAYNLPLINCSNRGLLDLGIKKNQKLKDVVENINVNNNIYKNCLSAFEIMKKEYIAYHEAIKNYNLKRGELYANRNWV